MTLRSLAVHPSKHFRDTPELRRPAWREASAPPERRSRPPRWAGHIGGTARPGGPGVTGVGEDDR
ncbi:hypothetical protein ACTMS2_08220 [Micromonospora sp. SD12]|uniref:hypothetical protein n=1 Tax=Micromonospora sp. SD12 TaxID=3452216 RepID=UPI003F8B41B0